MAHGKLTRKQRMHLAADLRRGDRTVADLARAYGVTARTVYRVRDEAGLGAVAAGDRRRRRDSGTRRQEMAPAAWQTLLRLVIDLGYSPREALRVMTGNGLIERGAVSERWVNRQLKSINMTRRQAARTGPQIFVRRERSGPNIEHQADATPAASIYIDARGDICYEPHDPLKKERQHQGKTRVHIFNLVDAYSRVTLLRAYDGETQENWSEFLYWCWSPKPLSQRGAMPFCGMPSILRADNGSGLTAHTTCRSLRELGVKSIPHPAGQAWKKGKTERALQSFQQLCEPATQLRKFSSFDELNLWLYEASIYLSHRTHGTTGKAPMALWSGIAADELREPPPRDEWDRLWLQEEEVLVRPTMTIKFGHGRWAEEVQLPLEHPVLSRYVGKRVTVLYGRGRSDPIIVRCHALAGLAATETVVQRVAPGAMPPSQLNTNLVAYGEAMLREAREAVPMDALKQLDPTAHWRDNVRTDWSVPVAGHRVRIADPSTLFRPEPVGLVRAIQIGQAAGIFAMPPSSADEAFLDALFAPEGQPRRERVERDEYDLALEGLRRARAGQGRPNHQMA